MFERRSLWMALLSALAGGCFAALGASFLLLPAANPEPSQTARAMAAAQARAPLRAGALRPVAFQDDDAPLDVEAAFREVISALEAGAGAQALSLLQTITSRAPGFSPARPVYRQLLAVEPRGSGGALDAQRLRELAEEGRIRLSSEKAVPPPDSVPNAVLRLSPMYRHLLVADLQHARVYVMENRDGALALVRHHYASMGKNGAGKQARGDNRTPIGVYHITRWLRDEALPELYGAGAWPTNYPNPWDVFRRRTGDGIWLHGVPRDTESRAPRSSEGCVTMANDDLLALQPYIDLGNTPVVLSNELEWVAPDALQRERDEFLDRIESWRSRWDARDTEAYLAFYGGDFTAEGMGRQEFAAHKRRVNAAKKFIEVELSEISLYRYPGTETPLMLAEFTMDYRSSNYRFRGRKQQFWKQDEAGEWKIFREENL
jgi:murein L,D-transpeptidase YafK